ncbi:MAG: type III pantothenate kinase [Flavobacteriales bacterium]|nr:type III pantothenate kinase [Flavobacteriales bacterium]
MDLAIDIGNTRAKIAFFEGRELIKYLVSSHKHIERTIQEAKLEYDDCIISSTKDISSLDLKEEFLEMSLILDHKTPLPIKLNYNTPETLGMDRIANAVGAISEFPNTDLMIVDIGTCITYDFITKEKEFLGGNISPGFHLRIRAMNSYTDKLPLIDLSEEHTFIGTSTEEALNNGVMIGCISEVEHYCDTFLEMYEEGKIVITGGDTEIFAKALKNSIFANLFLTLRGSNEILLYNKS